MTAAGNGAYSLYMMVFFAIPATAVIAFAGYVIVFDFRGLRRKMMHPKVNYSDFIRENPSRRVFHILLGGFFMLVASIGLIGLIASVATRL